MFPGLVKGIPQVSVGSVQADLQVLPGRTALFAQFLEFGGDHFAGEAQGLPPEKWQALDVIWKTILGLEASIEAARLSLDGLRAEMETAFRPIPVSVRARLAAASERLRSALREEPSVPASSAAW